MRILVDKIPRGPKDCPYAAISVKKNGDAWYICRWHQNVGEKKNELICNCDKWKGYCQYFKELRC